MRFIVASRKRAEEISVTGIQDRDGVDVDFAIVSITNPNYTSGALARENYGALAPVDETICSSLPL